MYRNLIFDGGNRNSGAKTQLPIERAQFYLQIFAMNSCLSIGRKFLNGGNAKGYVPARTVN
jgi:hypothetical protein